MPQEPIYQQIIEAIERNVASGALKPGDAVPSVRTMAQRWRCTPGTVQRAYRELVQRGVLAAVPGKETRVAEPLQAFGHSVPLRRAVVVHQVESVLLGLMGAGYSLPEVEQAVNLALDRWRVLSQEPVPSSAGLLRFAGSHDPATAMMAARLPALAPGWSMQMRFTGSLGGLIALARGEADLAGSHLLDPDSDAYNEPFVRHLLPGQRTALLTVAHRRLGLLVRPDRAREIDGLHDLAGSGLRFANRQPGSGTRVWLDAQLATLGIDAAAIAGYGRSYATHTAVAQAIASGQADAGLGVETAALAFGLHYRHLTRERYDLVIPEAGWSSDGVQAVVSWLTSTSGQQAIHDLGGYDAQETGALRWVT